MSQMDKTDSTDNDIDSDRWWELSQWSKKGKLFY